MNANFKNLIIRIPEKKKDSQQNRHIHVKNVETNKETSFEIDETEIEIISEFDLLNVFYDILTDVIDGERPYNEFCKKYRYSHYNKSTMEEWKLCKNSNKKFRNVYRDRIITLQKELFEVIDVELIVTDEN